ncbi:MAG: GNAT family N-acetyltransferase [Planctomycetaceae bacterium]
MNPNLQLRTFAAADALACWQLFQDTVQRVNGRDYSPEQIAAWANRSANPDSWCRRFEGKIAYVVEHDASIVGFADMTHDGYLDRLFVSADHQRMGVATLLMDAVQATAAQWHLPRIHTQASITAKPFFLSRGFVVVSEQTVECRGVRLTNFLMEWKSATHSVR